MNVLNQVLVLFLLILIGYIAQKVSVMNNDSVSHMTSLILTITLPSLIFTSLLKPFSKDLLAESGIILSLSFLVYGFSFLVAFFYPYLLKIPKFSQGAHRYAVIFPNVGFMGFPVVQAVLGSSALFYLSIYNIAFNLLAFSFGIWVLAKDSEEPLKLSWKTFINPCVGATLLGFLRFLFSIPIPKVIEEALSLTGSITAPLSMLIVGCILGRMKFASIFGHISYYATTFFRLILLPLCVGLFLYVMGARDIFLILPILVTAMPVAANTPFLAQLYKGDVEAASALVFISTLCSIVSIPLVALFATAVANG